MRAVGSFSVEQTLMQVWYVTADCAEGQEPHWMAQLICNFISILASVRTQIKVVKVNLSTQSDTPYMYWQPLWSSKQSFPFIPLLFFVSSSLLLFPFSQGSTWFLSCPALCQRAVFWLWLACWWGGSSNWREKRFPQCWTPGCSSNACCLQSSWMLAISCPSALSWRTWGRSSCLLLWAPCGMLFL